MRVGPQRLAYSAKQDDPPTLLKRKVDQSELKCDRCIRHRWERRGLDVVFCAEISPSLLPNYDECNFSYEYLSKTAKSNCAVKRMGESVRWADLTIRLTVKANNMSAIACMQATTAREKTRNQIIGFLYILLRLPPWPRCNVPGIFCNINVFKIQVAISPFVISKTFKCFHIFSCTLFCLSQRVCDNHQKSVNLASNV